MKSIFDMSTPEKLNDGSLFLLRGNEYLAVDFTSWLESAAMIDYWYSTGTLNLEEPILESFLKRRNLYVKKDLPLIKSRESYYDGRQGLVYVLSTEKAREGLKKPYHGVRLWNYLAPSKKDSKDKKFTPEQRISSARSFNVNCTCSRLDFQATCRAPEVWKQFYNDYRSNDAVPTPANTTVLDRHAFTSVQYGVIFFGIDGLGVFDFPSNAVEGMRKAIKKQVKNRDRINNYFFNPILTKTEMIIPWADLVKFAFNLDLYRIIPKP